LPLAAPQFAAITVDSAIEYRRGVGVSRQGCVLTPARAPQGATGATHCDIELPCLAEAFVRDCGGKSVVC
jgi:hypothetical protein